MYEAEEASSTIVLVDALLHSAISKGASDVHFEPISQGLRVRFRVDGVLHEQLPIRDELAPQIISRLKVLARIDIAERRIPQDGKFSFKNHDRDVDLRVSTFPSIHGEKVVVRILDRAAHAINLDGLGFASSTLIAFKQLLSRAYGFFLVTGPTGSGKTTTLYAALSFLHSEQKNTITLEDPVEYDIRGITQGQVNPHIGFSFARGIRAVLRQDPDILMVGEIRDRETAATAIEASLTGHILLSTLHTNDAPSAVIRLMDMGIEPFLINASLTGVLAQRLARTVCSECTIMDKPNDLHKRIMEVLQCSLDAVPHVIGCYACDNLGYKGRIGIFELLIVTHALRNRIVQSPNIEQLRTQAVADGMQTLLVDGLQKVQDGLISLEELARVVIT